MNIDLHSEVAVSRLVYIKKVLLEKYLIEQDFNGCQIPVLEKPIALALILSHSLYKEQLLTLADYYTTLLYIINATQRQREMLIDFAKEACIGFSIKLALMIVNSITEIAFGKTHSAITGISRMIQTSKFEETNVKLSVSNFLRRSKLPFRYNLMTILTAFTVKVLHDPVMCSTIINQLSELVNNSSDFYKSTLQHLKREAS
jgi:hypothetical protein